jgi:hypothetical protein
MIFNKIKNIQFILVIISLFLLLSSCNGKNDKDINKTNPTIKKNKVYQSLFLGLNPQMSEKEFSNKIVELNKTGKLENKKFPLSIDGEEFLFDINKRQNSIRLNYTDEYTLQKKCKSSLFFKKYKVEFNSKRNKFNKQKISFINILEKKYLLNKFQFPKNFDFDRIGLECYVDCGYKIFVDKDKYIVFGTSIYGLEDYYILTGGTYHEEKDEDNVFDKMITNHNYGMKIFIYYFPIKEFDKIIQNEINLENHLKELQKKKEESKIQNTNEL